MGNTAQPAAWWQTFFDDEYVRVWGDIFTAEQSAAQAEALWNLLVLAEGSRVLDAGCGYGRLSRPLAERGAVVLGVDQSADLLAHAERQRGGLPETRLRYLHHDLRQPLGESGFDAAFNVFTAIGYGTDEDDLAIFTTIRNALRPGGLFLLETNHRDATVAFFARGGTWAKRRADGTIVIEEPHFDAIRGRVNTTWYWSGPHGSGHKSASIRIYTPTELVCLLERAGLELRSTHAGLSSEPYRPEGPEMGGRIALVAQCK